MHAPVKSTPATSKGCVSWILHLTRGGGSGVQAVFGKAFLHSSGRLCNVSVVYESAVWHWESSSSVKWLLRLSLLQNVDVSDGLHKQCCW